jgi:hypothetical protein
MPGAARTYFLPYRAKYVQARCQYVRNAWHNWSQTHRPDERLAFVVDGDEAFQGHLCVETPISGWLLIQGRNVERFVLCQLTFRQS